MNFWSFLMAVTGIITSAAILAKVIRRPEPGIEGVLMRGGNFKPNKHTKLPPEHRDGVDNAKLYRNHFRLVAWPQFRPSSLSKRRRIFLLVIWPACKRFVLLSKRKSTWLSFK